MKHLRSLLPVLLFATILPSALPQSLPNMALVRLRYTVLKRTTKMDGDLKAKIDAND